MLARSQGRCACPANKLALLDMATDRRSETTAQRFGRAVADAARAAGYDIDSPRGGGKARLARDTGMAESSVGRMLSGKTLPDPRFYEPIAKAVRMPVRTLLVEAEIISDPSLTEPTRTRVVSTTPEQAATELGFTDPVERELFLGMVARLRRERTPTSAPAAADDDTETGGEAAQA